MGLPIQEDLSGLWAVVIILGTSTYDQFSDINKCWERRNWYNGTPLGLP